VNESDPAVAYERLKIETAGMLNLNVASSSLLENLQVDLVSLLRLQIDDLQAKVLSGEQVDLNRLSTALTMLRQLLPERALVSAPPPPETRFGSEHRERLRRLIEKAVRSDDEAEAERLRDVREREELAAAVAAGASVEAAKAAPPVTAALPPPQRAANVVPINRPPDHYLAEHQHRNQPWRGGDGAIVAPAWPLPER
jgi:hypothetical protein